MSLLWLTGLPRACSGLIYAAVPNTIPAWVSCRILVLVKSLSISFPSLATIGSKSFARPKSRSLVWPSWASMMLSDLISLWTILALWALLRPSATWRAISTDPTKSSSWLAINCLTVLPSTNSITMNVIPSASSTS